MRALRQRADFLRRIRGSGGRVEFFVGWFSGFSSGEILPHLLLRELGELEIDLALDVYGAEPSAAD